MELGDTLDLVGERPKVNKDDLNICDSSNGRMVASLIVLVKSRGRSYIKANNCWVKMKDYDVLLECSKDDIKAVEA